MIKPLFSLILACFSCNAAADWTYSTHSNELRLYFSPSSVRDIVSGFKQAWTMHENITNGNKVAYLVEYDCLNGSAKVSKGVTYDLQGNTIGNVVDFLNMPFQPTVPGTVGYGMLQSVCNFSHVYAHDNRYQGRNYCAENGSCFGDVSKFNGLLKTNYVNGYYRSNGTYVRGHYRSR